MNGIIFHSKVADLWYEKNNKSSNHKPEDVGKIKSIIFVKSRKILSKIIFYWCQIFGLLIVFTIPVLAISTHNNQYIGDCFIRSMLFLILPWGIFVHYLTSSLRKDYWIC